jgi:hypothetical protein
MNKKIKLPLPEEFLYEFADLCEKHNVGLDYTNQDDGIHISVNGEDVFVGFLFENAADIIREAISGNKKA